jgi:hypothetical protein
MSTHYHMLLLPADHEELSAFMGYINCNLSKEVDCLVQWRGAMWSGPYHEIPVSGEEEIQIARLKYLLANSVKDGLVERPEQWPGVQSATALCNGEDLTGVWYNRSRLWNERNVHRNEDASEDDVSTEERVCLVPLPCWAHLLPEEYQRRIRELVEDVVEAAARERELSGRSVLGAEAALQMDPHYYPEYVERSPQPRFHTFREAVYKEMYQAHSEVYAFYRDAAERFRGGDRNVEFHEWTFPPALPFARGAPA